MGGLKSVAEWSADDDRLLKNAVEDGASLESLAKGAVTFSHRFTIEELQQRWQSLLYDVDTSTEASARIINFEIELSISSPLKSNRACNSKEKDQFGKRQGGTVRSHYHAMRKRDFRASCSTNLNFLLPPSSYIGTNNSCGYEDMFLGQGHEYNNFAGKVHMSKDYEHPEIFYESEQQAFLEATRVDSATASGNICYNVYDTGYVGSGDEEFLNGMGDHNEIYRYTENISPASIDKTRGNDVGQSFDYDYGQEDFFNTYMDVQETKSPQILPTSNPSENDDPRGKPISVFDSTNCTHESFPPAFFENHNLTSPDPNSSASFQQLGYSSLPPATSFWTPTEDICEPTIQMDGYLEDKDQGVVIIDDFMAINSDDNTSEPKLNNGMPSSRLNNSTDILESDFKNLPTFVDFGNVVELDIKEDIDDDTSFVNHIEALLSSDSDTPDDVPNSSDPRAAECLNSCAAIPVSAGSNESYNPCDKMNLSHNNNSIVCVSQTSMSSTAEPHAEFLNCTLNTEDQEIPCNDGVSLLPPSQVLPPFASFDLKQTSREITSCNEVKAENRELTTVIEEQLASSLEAGSSLLPKAAVTDPSDGYIIKTEPFQSPTTVVAVQYASVVALQEAEELSGLGKHGNPDTSTSFFLEKPAKLTDNSEPYSTNRHNDCIQDAAMQQTEMVSPDLVSPDATGNMPTSNREEQSSDSENAMPNFYDIESLILDMDLGTYDNKSCLLAKEASRNYSMDSKKTIIRLEQGAHSYMNRVISSHGAFAVFYGCHLKYFIKEREVTIGRATEEYIVDIDLGREGRANKISRIQAIIRLKDDGIFVLKNYGKCSVFVNGKEVQPKRSAKLSTGSLIEIKEMRFMFEANESAAKHYIAHTSMKQPKTEQMI